MHSLEYNRSNRSPESEPRCFSLQTDLQQTVLNSAKHNVVKKVKSSVHRLAAANRVARSLFGPPDHQENEKFGRDLEATLEADNRSRWNFDFVQEKALDGRFDWNKVPFHSSQCQQPSST